jgi:hypothetical protein
MPHIFPNIPQTYEQIEKPRAVFRGMRTVARQQLHRKVALSLQPVQSMLLERQAPAAGFERYVDSSKGMVQVMSYADALLCEALWNALGACVDLARSICETRCHTPAHFPI